MCNFSKSHSGHDNSLFHIFDNSLFAGLIFGRFTVIFLMSKRFFFQCSDEKIPLSSRQNFEEKTIVLSSKLCLKLFVYFFRSHFYRLLASLSCYYDVNPVVALSGPYGVVPSYDRHISRGLLLCINR